MSKRRKDEFAVIVIVLFAFTVLVRTITVLVTGLP
jgi:hypothetical protein